MFFCEQGYFASGFLFYIFYAFGYNETRGKPRNDKAKGREHGEKNSDRG